MELGQIDDDASTEKKAVIAAEMTETLQPRVACSTGKNTDGP
jgi:hypothetical protein